MQGPHLEFIIYHRKRRAMVAQIIQPSMETCPIHSFDQLISGVHRVRLHRSCHGKERRQISDRRSCLRVLGINQFLLGLSGNIQCGCYSNRSAPTCCPSLHQPKGSQGSVRLLAQHHQCR